MLRKVETHLLEAGRYAVLAHLAAGLAHEIRNPLHAIGLNAGAVQEHVNANRSSPRYLAMSEALSTIQDETRRLTDLLTNYLGLVRPSSTPGPVDLRELCRRVIRLLEYTARTAKVELVLEGDEQLPEIVGERDRLQQAILNLVLNAVQAMPDGGTVRVRTSHDAGLVRVTVLDTGPGLPPEVQEHLFDVRVTTKPGGTGLGLPLVRLIAEAHGGSIWYRSTPGEGAAFTLVIPARVAATA
jgi:signal transduction histidine kinase